MRTPVATIKLYTELLQAGVAEPGLEQADMLSTIDQECDRLTTTIDNVLGFSRLRQGKWAYRFEAVSSRSLVVDAVQTIRPLLRSRGMTCAISCLHDVTLEADQEAIHQVLINLITNAVKYAADGKELIVSVLPAGRDQVAFEVLDFGPGIPAAEHQRIFQPFYRVGDELTRTQSGSGLGLALVQEHVKAHHGTITVASTREQGTTFRICLPIAQPVTTRSVRSAET
jgi:signal transduction histidine kinase